MAVLPNAHRTIRLQGCHCQFNRVLAMVTWRAEFLPTANNCIFPCQVRVTFSRISSYGSASPRDPKKAHEPTAVVNFLDAY